MSIRSTFVRIIKNGLDRWLGMKLVKSIDFKEKAFSAQGREWDYRVTDHYWIGGQFKVSNLSSGYHGILIQWLEAYSKDGICLLVSENNKIKAEFKSKFPEREFLTLDFYDNQGEEIDIRADLCRDSLGSHAEKFDAILCQATLEHLYNPLGAIKNMAVALKHGGVILIHTHTPLYPYHAYPRDYFRFYADWFEDLPLFNEELKLIELYTIGGQIFVGLQRV